MPDDTTQAVMAESMSSRPSPLLHLYVIDATPLGAGTFRFVNDRMPDGSNIVWRGESYTPYAVAADGFVFRVQGELPRPHIQLSNIFGAFTSLNLNYQDLVGARLIRRRVFARFLDNGPEPNPNASWPDDVFFFHQKVKQNKMLVEYELSSVLEIENVSLPRRQVFSDLCAWGYRSAECTYTGPVVADSNGNPPPVPVGTDRGVWHEDTVYNTGDVTQTREGHGRKLYGVCLHDNTSGTDSEPPNSDYWWVDDCSLMVVNGCKLRFLTGDLPFGAFPGTQQLPIAANAGS